jgi:hypothetical protein
VSPFNYWWNEIEGSESKFLCKFQACVVELTKISIIGSTLNPYK